MAFPKIDGFVVVEKLGSGTYSTVYKAFSKNGPRAVVAIKCVLKTSLKHSETAIDNLITEIRLLKTLKHPYIVEMKDFTWDDKHIFIVTEFCNAGDLSKYIQSRGRVSERQCLLFLQQLATALKFLRDKGVVHMDLKPHNLLLNRCSDQKMTLKVADFGFAQYMSDETRQHSIRGSPLYMAPEMLLRPEGQKPTYDARVDLWSVGVIVYECLFGRAPYSSSTFKELMNKIQSQQRIEIPANSSISPECQDLLTRLLQHDPAHRITYEEFFKHDFLDLDHMPTKENYDKAVQLIKKAIDLDHKKEYEQAFHLYCESLRYFVPIINLELDPIKRSALRAKINRYVKRAEELKVFTTFGEETATPSLSKPADTTKTVKKHNTSCFAMLNGQSMSKLGNNSCLACNTVQSLEFGNSSFENGRSELPVDAAGSQNQDGVSSNVSLEEPVLETVGESCILNHQSKSKEQFQILYALCRSTPSLQFALETGRQGEQYAAEGAYALALQRYQGALTALLTGVENEPQGQRREMLMKKIEEWLREAESVKGLHATTRISQEPEGETHKDLCSIQ